MSQVFTETITESQDFNLGWSAESQIEETTGIIKNVPLCGNVSKNGYKIPSTAFKDVKALYEGKPVCINHSTQAVKGRGLEELAGFVRNARMHEGRPWGDIHTEGCAKRALLLDAAKAHLPNVGLSHTARYRWGNRAKESVAEVEEVFTVDAVLFPATTKNFQERDSSEEQYMPADTVELLTSQLKETRESYDAKIADLQKKFADLESSKTALEASLKAASQERDEAKAKVASFEAAKELADRRAAVVESCKKAGLDTENAKLCPPSWLGYVCSIESQADQQKAISEHAELLKTVSSGKGPTSQERQSGGTGEFSTESALKGIRFTN